MSFKRKPPPGNVRRVVSLGQNLRGVTTNKQGQLVQFESEQERKLLLLFERDPTVHNYRSQPETIPFLDAAGRQRRYTPDFQVWRTDGRIEWHEVTLTTRREQGVGLPEREVAAQRVCQQRGWRYVVHTEATLPSGYVYTNLDFLAAFRGTSYAEAASQHWWLTALTAGTRVHPLQVCAQRGATLPQGTLCTTLYHLLWHDLVQMDWQQPLLWRGAFHPGARIWLPSALEQGSQGQEGRP